MTRGRSAEQRAREVERWRASGQSAWAYARERGVSRSTVMRWAAEAREPAFVRVEVMRARERELVVEVGGAAVRVAAGFDPSLLREVVAALAAEPR